MGKLTQRLIQWIPFSAASVWTFHSFWQGFMQHEWTQFFFPAW